jgi:hypothetical protein
MKKLLGLLLLACSLSLAAGVSAQVDWTSRYVWRGFDLSGNRSCLQPQVTFEFGQSGFALNLWSSFCLQDRSLTKDLDEIDATLSYTIPTGDSFALEAGVTLYGFYFVKNFKMKDQTTPEVYLKGSLPNVPLAPSLTVFYDFNLGSGFYALLGVEHSLKLGETLSLDLSGSLGYNGKLFIDDSGFSDLAVGAALPLSLGKATLTPYVKYSLSLLDSVNENNEFWFGASLGI